MCAKNNFYAMQNSLFVLRCKRCVILYRYRKSSQLFTGVSANVHVNGLSLKYGFRWLRKQNTFDAVVVDEWTNSSVLENLVFTYDMLLYRSIRTDLFRNCMRFGFCGL